MSRILFQDVCKIKVAFKYVYKSWSQYKDVLACVLSVVIRLAFQDDVL